MTKSSCLLGPVVLLTLLAASAGCQPSFGACAVQCGSGATPCPAGLTCGSDGYCHARAGETCAAADAGTHHDAAACDGAACSTCGDGQHECGGACWADSDTAHCGPACTSCPVAPDHATMACVAGECRDSCVTDFTRCGESCVDLTGDPSHCGRCDRACETDQNCVDGECRLNPCGGGLHECGDSCVSNDDVAHCGSRCTACPVPANATATCDGVACGWACWTGYHDCGGSCVSATSVASCGASCQACPAPPANAVATCDGVSCGWRCTTGYHDCGGVCVSSTSVATCGTSCDACPAPPANADATCDGTGCGYACTSGYQPCGSSCIPVTQSCACTDWLGVGKLGAAVKRTDGTFWVWGSNTFGALGTGTTSVRTSPTQATVIGSTDEVALGGPHSCARRTDGSLWCWGNNAEGELGNGSATDSLTPVRVTALGTAVAQVAVGTYNTCAVTTDHQLWCWGDNTFGVVGDGTSTDRREPVAIATGVARVSVGVMAACAVKTDNTLWCWGYQPTGGGSLRTPTQVTSLGDQVAQVTVGDAHKCAIKLDGSLWCWGYNEHGELGDGTYDNRAAPVAVLGLTSGVKAVAVGLYYFTCAVKNTGTLWCWGNNEDGQLGQGNTTGLSTPAQVPGFPAGVDSVGAGIAHVCARETDGTVWCWGQNDLGQVGVLYGNSELSPVHPDFECP